MVENGRQLAGGTPLVATPATVKEGPKAGPGKGTLAGTGVGCDTTTTSPLRVLDPEHTAQKNQGTAFTHKKH